MSLQQPAEVLNEGPKLGRGDTELLPATISSQFNLQCRSKWVHNLQNLHINLAKYGFTSLIKHRGIKMMLGTK